jgi:hypothetical protein
VRCATWRIYRPPLPLDPSDENKRSRVQENKGFFLAS